MDPVCVYVRRPQSLAQLLASSRTIDALRLLFVFVFLRVRSRRSQVLSTELLAAPTIDDVILLLFVVRALGSGGDGLAGKIAANVGLKPSEIDRRAVAGLAISAYHGDSDRWDLPKRRELQEQRRVIV